MIMVNYNVMTDLLVLVSGDSNELSLWEVESVDPFAVPTVAAVHLYYVNARLVFVQ